MRQGNPLGIKGIDHVHFYVRDAEQFVSRYVYHFNFNVIATANTKCFGVLEPINCKSTVINQYRINFVVTQPDLNDQNEVTQHVLKHGDGVHDVAFLVEDAGFALIEAERRGAKITVPLQIDKNVHGELRWGTISTYGDVVHTFIDRSAYNRFAPNYISCLYDINWSSDISLFAIDHIVANVENMREWVAFYENVFGFKQTQHFDIRTKRSALMSMVLEDEKGYIKLPINEPFAEGTIEGKDQIREYLDDNNGPGIQHIAFLTNNIIPTIREMTSRGVEFLSPEAKYEYYEALPKRVGKIDEDLKDLRETNVLVDRESDSAYLLQIFTKRHPFFEEIIQRKGDSVGFGQGNFQALFEAIEKEQIQRGTLR